MRHTHQEEKIDFFPPNPYLVKFLYFIHCLNLKFEKMSYLHLNFSAAYRINLMSSWSSFFDFRCSWNNFWYREILIHIIGQWNSFLALMRKQTMDFQPSETKMMHILSLEKPKRLKFFPNFEWATGLWRLTPSSLSLEYCKMAMEVNISVKNKDYLKICRK